MFIQFFESAFDYVAETAISFKLGSKKNKKERAKLAKSNSNNCEEELNDDDFVHYVTVKLDVGRQVKPPKSSWCKQSLATLPEKKEGHIRIVFISDTHERHRSVSLPPSGDIFMHGGDILFANRLFSQSFSEKKLKDFASWLKELPYNRKIFIGGNHDLALTYLGRQKIEEIFAGCEYLEDEEIEISGLRIWASPFSRGDSKNRAFQNNYAERFIKIPKEGQLDILLTHQPWTEHILKTIRPKIHASGHAHCLNGVRQLGQTLCVNGSIMDGSYAPVQEPIVIDVKKT